MPGHLERLIAPLSTDQFFERHWPDEFLVTTQGTDTVGELLEAGQLQSLDAALSANPGTTMAMLPDRDDEHSAIKVDRGSARRLHDHGFNLLLPNVHEYLAVVRRWLVGIASDLGLPRETRLRSLIYASRAGHGAVAHYDANVNLVLQLRGAKRWWIAPNRHVRYPTERWAVNMPHLPRELRPHPPETLPADIPDDAAEVVLQRGSVLYLPRGCWHKTSAVEDSLSLNFTFPQTTWADLVASAVRSLLSTHTEWRADTAGVGGRSSKRRAVARAQLEVMLKDFKARVADLTADQVLDVTQGRDRFAIARQAMVEDAGADLLITLDPARADKRIQLEDDGAAIVRWIAASEMEVCVEDVTYRFPSLSPATAAGMLDALAAEGVLSRAG
jgi:50S ribosomal protein L16 3-hydroxylase